MDLDPSLLQDFLTESSELIDQLDQDLVTLESIPEDEQQEVCNSCFRALHTIKGAASFLGLTAVTTFAHAAEDALNKLRKGEVAVSPAIMDALLQSADVVREQVEALTAGDEAPEGPKELIDVLHAITEGKAGGDTSPAGEADTPASSEASNDDGAKGEKLELPANKLDLLEFMTADLRDAVKQLDGVFEELTNDATRADAAQQIIEVAGQVLRTAEFFNLAELTDLVKLLSETAPKLADLDTPTSLEIAVRLKAACALIEKQADAMDNGRLLSFPIDTLAERIDLLSQGQALPKEATGAHNQDVEALLVLDGVVETSPEPAASEPEASSTPTEPGKPAPTGTKSSKPTEKKAAAVEQTIRVEVSRLESLLNLVGQLVLNKNRLLALTRGLRDGAVEHEVIEQFTTASGDLDRLTSELQVGVMRTRMQPLAKLFDRYPRVIRDMARMTDKKINLEIVGKDTEVDKSVLEALADPLVHILRNSADHGVERPEDRKNAGKDETGTIKLQAEHQGSHVRVAITDDGKGLDREVLGKKAVERGLVTAEQLAQMPDGEVFRFIFAAGLSTAKQVSDLSGRGVGMDVVRTNIQKINGEIHIDSAKGKGTTIEILIPLTVAIMPAMVVGVGAHLYSIPLQTVVEIVKPEDIGTYSVSGFPVMRLRDSVLPLLNLGEILDEEAPSNGRPFAVVVSVAGTRAGLCVDRLVGQQEIVIKPLDDGYTQGGPFSGATIREDGEVSLILDVAQMIRNASQQVQNAERESAKRETAKAA